jgi:hypothetical protein
MDWIVGHIDISITNPDTPVPDGIRIEGNRKRDTRREGQEIYSNKQAALHRLLLTSSASLSLLAPAPPHGRHGSFILSNKPDNSRLK